MSENERKFYRDKYNGKLFGVCAGVGDYFGIDALWIRLAVIALVIFTPLNIVIIPGYFIITLITPKKPPYLYQSDYERIFGDGDRVIRPTSRREDQ